MKLDAMHPLMYRRKRRAAQQVERHQAEIGADLAARLAALDEAIDAGDGRLPAEALAPARELARRAGERLRMSGTHTVVALAGATGSGKSSLFNALAGVPVSAVGLRRPTTAAAHAVIWGAEGAGPLLDWLQVPRRHYLDFVDRPEGDHRLDGLVLLDLPDHDSTTAAHRIEVDRLVGLVDVLVWVLDPQKYADAAVHERYLRPLATHTEVMVVVLNQSDRLPAHHLDPALDDLRRLLAADGLGPVPVLATSAVSARGTGRPAGGTGRRGGRPRGGSAAGRCRSGGGVGRAGHRGRRAGPAVPGADRRGRADRGAERGGRRAGGHHRGPPGLPTPGRARHGFAVPALAAPAAAGPAAPAAPGATLRRRDRARSDLGPGDLRRAAGPGRRGAAGTGRSRLRRAARAVAGRGARRRPGPAPPTWPTRWTARSSAPTSGGPRSRRGGE